jgi:four helix bundle protein
MSEDRNTKRYDLEERTTLFAKSVRSFIRKLPKTISNIKDVKQLVRASGSVGANYIEANDAISKKDFLFRMKICRKESQKNLDTGLDYCL